VADCANANCDRLCGNRHGRRNGNADGVGAETFYHVCQKSGAIAQVPFRDTTEFMYKTFTIAILTIAYAPSEIMTEEYQFGVRHFLYGLHVMIGRFEM
jgi:hypothetical protein